MNIYFLKEWEEENGNFLLVEVEQSECVFKISSFVNKDRESNLFDKILF